MLITDCTSASSNGPDARINAWFDHLGREFVHNAPANVIAIVSMAALATLLLIRKLWLGKSTSLEEAPKVFLALLGLGTSFLVASVFLLTSPPAYDELSLSDRVLMGGVTFLVLTFLASNEVRAFLSK